MGWSGRAPTPPAMEAERGRQDKEHAMSRTLNTASPANTGDPDGPLRPLR
jgi:hypothetical protein